MARMPCLRSRCEVVRSHAGVALRAWRETFEVWVVGKGACGFYHAGLW